MLIIDLFARLLYLAKKLVMVADMVGGLQEVVENEDVDVVVEGVRISHSTLRTFGIHSLHPRRLQSVAIAAWNGLA